MQIPKKALNITLDNWPGLALVLIEDGTVAFTLNGKQIPSSQVYEKILADILEGPRVKIVEGGEPWKKSQN